MQRTIALAGHKINAGLLPSSTVASPLLSRPYRNHITRHSGERRNPALTLSNVFRQHYWIPAFAGMTVSRCILSLIRFNSESPHSPLRSAAPALR